jgi:hypothetical protein
MKAKAGKASKQSTEPSIHFIGGAVLIHNTESWIGCDIDHRVSCKKSQKNKSNWHASAQTQVRFVKNKHGVNSTNWIEAMGTVAVVQHMKEAGVGGVLHFPWQEGLVCITHVHHSNGRVAHHNLVERLIGVALVKHTPDL